MRQITQILTPLFLVCSLFYSAMIKAQTATEDTLMNLAIHGSLWTFVGSFIWGKNPLIEGSQLKPQWGLGTQLGVDNDILLTQTQLTRPFQNTLYQAHQWQLNAHWEFDIGYWQSNQKQPLNASGYFIGITPVFNYLWQSPGLKPYLEVGAGIKYLDNIVIENRYKSTQFQFGDIFGFGLQQGSFQIGYRYLHISNANIALPNPGNNFQTLHFQYLF